MDYYNNPYQRFGTSLAMPPQQLIRVSGMEGARAYQMPANASVALFDANNDVMFIKTTDGAGFPTIRAFSFTEIKENTQRSDNLAQFVTKDEFTKAISAIEAKLGGNNGKQSVSE